MQVCRPPPRSTRVRRYHLQMEHQMEHHWQQYSDLQGEMNIMKIALGGIQIELQMLREMMNKIFCLQEAVTAPDAARG